MAERNYDSWTMVSLVNCPNRDCQHMNPAEREECGLCGSELS